jgi:hypothetical protein
MLVNGVTFTSEHESAEIGKGRHTYRLHLYNLVKVAIRTSLVPRPHPQKEGKGSGDFGPIAWFGRLDSTPEPTLGARADTGTLEQSLDLIGQ